MFWSKMVQLTPGLFQRAIACNRFRSRHGEVWFHPAPEPLKLHTGILKGKDIPIIMGSLPTIFSDRGVPFHMNSEAHAFVPNLSYLSTEQEIQDHSKIQGRVKSGH